MASSYPASVGAVQVGSYFVQQYYQVLQQQPDFVHHFYKDASTMVRVDGDSSDSASAILQIHTIIMSLNFTGIEIKTINSLESCNGGVLVVVSGSVKSKDFSGWRKFVQTFFLAPQENGYFVLNDIFHFVSEEVIHQHPAPVLSDNRVDPQLTTSSPLPESPVPDYALEVEGSETLNSVHIDGDDPVDEYSLQEQQQQPEEEEEYPVADSVEEETPLEESYALPQNVEDVEQEPLPVVEESIGEPRKLTYASILQAAKGKSAPSVATRSFINKSPPPASELHQTAQPSVQPSNPVSSFVTNSSVEVVEEGLSQEEEGESKSVYVRNLPSTVSTLDILQEFKNFGTIKPDGVFLRNRKEIGVCYAFVEFEDAESVQNAIKASPLQMDGRQVYIEERRANSSSTSRGGRRGRGRGSYQNEAPRGRFGARTSGRGNGVRGSY